MLIYIKFGYLAPWHSKYRLCVTFSNHIWKKWDTEVCLFQFILIHCYSSEMCNFMQIKTEIFKVSLPILYLEKQQKWFSRLKADFRVISNMPETAITEYLALRGPLQEQHLKIDKALCECKLLGNIALLSHSLALVASLLVCLLVISPWLSRLSKEVCPDPSSRIRHRLIQFYSAPCLNHSSIIAH